MALSKPALADQTQKTTILNRTYIVKGMDCPTCAQTVERGLSDLKGIQSVVLNYSTQKLRIDGNIQDEEIFSRVRELGYEIETEGDQHPFIQLEAPAGFKQYLLGRPDSLNFLIGLLFIFPGLIVNEILGLTFLLADISSVVALLAAGIPVFRSAWRSVRISRDININVLMSIAGIGAVAIGAFTEAGMVMVLFLLGEIIEGYTAERTRNSIRSLIGVVPQTASLVERDASGFVFRTVPVSELRIGDHIIVKPGEKIPMDGKVIQGGSAVNQASITGESQPVDKFPGSLIFASSINGEGVLEIEVTNLVEDNTISRLIRMVEEAQEKRAPAQRFVDRFARVYTPFVVLVALLVAVIPPLIFGQPFLNPAEDIHGWLYRGLALLVVGCPCALVISIPVSIASAISNAAKEGVLVKGGVYLELLHQIRTIAFDKTGTLTEGKPAVVRTRSVGCIAHEVMSSLAVPIDQSDHIHHCESCAEMVTLAAAVEQHSEHPFASAVVEYAQNNELLNSYPAVEISALAGRGIQGQINGFEVVVGSHMYFDAHYPHLVEWCETARKDAEEGLTPLMVSKEGVFIGTISVTDTVREGSRESLKQMKDAGVKRLVMITGDDQRVADRVAAEVGIDEVHAQLLPEKKVRIIHHLQAQFGKIAMVGDGINDTPALASADVGIAMGTAVGGTAQAMETADVTLMSGNLRKMAFLLKLSSAAMRTIYINVGLSIFLKLLVFVLVLLGFGTMWMAVVADVGTSLVVTLYGLRLLNYPKSSG